MSKENELDKKTALEMDAIAHMIKYADKNGLLSEVIYAFAQALLRKDLHQINDDTLKIEAYSALMEWDC